MLYTFAMATAVIWGLVLTPFFAATVEFPYLMELVRWVGPLTNLIVIKWWLDRTATRAAVVRLPSGAKREANHRDHVPAHGQAA